MKIYFRFVLFVGLFLVLNACVPPPAARPNVTIASPANGTQYRVGEDVAIQSTSTDANGIASVELLVDNQSVKIEPSPTGKPQPQFTTIQVWNATTPGSHLVIVRAANANGATNEAGINITVVGQVAANATNTSTPAPTIVVTDPSSSLTPTTTTTSALANATNTATLIPSTLTFTPIPPTRTFTPIPLTATRAPTRTPTRVPPDALEIVQLDYVNPKETLTGKASCPSNRLRTGGGFVSLANPTARVYGSEPVGNGWWASVTSIASTQIGFFTRVICVSNLTGEITHVTGQKIVPSDTGYGFGPIDVSCPAGTIVMGGGYGADAGFQVYISRMKGAGKANGWEIAVKNLSGVSRVMNVYAVCYSGAGADSIQVDQEAESEGKNITAVANCPSGRILTGGGFGLRNFVPLTQLDIWDLQMEGASGWKAIAFNTTATKFGLYAHAICTKF